MSLGFKRLICIFLYNFLNWRLIETLHYKLECPGFEFRWCYWDFFWLHPFGRTMAMVSTQPVTEIMTKDVFWV